MNGAQDAEGPVDELHRRAHLHHGAHLPPGKFKLWREVGVLPPGSLGFNEEEGGQSAPEGRRLVWCPAGRAGWMSVGAAGCICLRYSAV